LTFLVFFKIFDEFCKISVSTEKEKKEKKKKVLHGLGPAHNEADPATNIQPRLKKKPTRSGPLGSGHFALGTLIYFKNY
jgi:hypothetical protein